MRLVAIAALLLACLCAVAVAAEPFVSQFEAFKAKYSRKYATPAEEAKRFRIFVQNMKKAAKFQAANPHARFGINEFADVSAEEFKIRHSADKFFAAAKNNRRDVVSIPAAKAGASKVDWRTKGAVTGVKNQENCGSQWAFSTTGSIEGQWFLAGNALTSLSEQFLVSCDTIDSGCNGGLMDNAFIWLLIDNGGVIVTEASYPYVCGEGNIPLCNNGTGTFGAKISSFKNLPHDETQMGQWVLTGGPLSVAVDGSSWQAYTGGIMTNCVSNQLDHAVLIVGFDDTNNPSYWIVKNSWGTSWGENGYIRIQKGTNQCLINNYPTTSIVGGSGPTPAPNPTTALPPTTPTPTTTPVPPPAPSGQWIDLFQPPYDQCPSVMMAISCINKYNCFVPGGSNGVGFDVLRFNGRQNGRFTPLYMPSQAAMMAAIGMGGTALQPHGAAGGFGIGNGVQYAVNATTFSPSYIPTLFVVTQDIRADKATGQKVLVVDNAGSNAVLYSGDGGARFNEKTISSPLPASCTGARYGAMVGANTWYVTFGSWPNQNKSPNTHQISERASLLHDPVTRKKSRVARKMLAEVGSGSGSGSHSGSGGNQTIYTAAIVKTTDGGNRWNTIFSKATTFYFNEIDCISATHCVAVAEGFDANAGARIFLTTDGTNFNQVFFLPSTGSAAYSLMAVRFATKNEIWAAGSAEGAASTQSLFVVSKDGGKTWTQSSSLQYIGEITDLDFLRDGTGFATAITESQVSTILRYTPEIQKQKELRASKL